MFRVRSNIYDRIFRYEEHDSMVDFNRTKSTKGLIIQFGPNCRCRMVVTFWFRMVAVPNCRETIKFDRKINDHVLLIYGILLYVVAELIVTENSFYK